MNGKQVQTKSKNADEDYVQLNNSLIEWRHSTWIVADFTTFSLHCVYRDKVACHVRIHNSLFNKIVANLQQEFTTCADTDGQTQGHDDSNITAASPMS